MSPHVSMGVEVAVMLFVLAATLSVGCWLARRRVKTASWVSRVVCLGPVLVAGSIAMFSVEHFLNASELSTIVPKWLPEPVLWTYFFGTALVAAAVSLTTWTLVRAVSLLLALFFLLIVATSDLPQYPAAYSDRILWVLTARELGFAAGALILAAAVGAPAFLARAGRAILAGVLVFYGVEHFLHPLHVPGVPLEKLTPLPRPAAAPIAILTGTVLLVAAPALLVPRTRRVAAAGAGSMAFLLAIFFYGPILLREIHTSAAIDGLNYVGDTMLFAGTILLGGWDNATLQAQPNVSAQASR